MNNNGQPAFAINYKENATKAIRSLLGFLHGLSADGILTAQEAITLDAWLRDQFFLKNDPDVIDILDITTDILSDGGVTEDELEDLKTQIEDVLHYREEAAARKKDQVNQLLGIVRGITADNRINEKELLTLREWISGVYGLDDEWPFNIIIERIDDVLSDGIITTEEHDSLLETLSGIAGYDDSLGIVSGLAATVPLESVDIDIDGSRFCVTGSLLYGTRVKLHGAIERLGGVVSASVTKNLDYLVIGSMSSRDWSHSSYGRKLEKAIQLKSQGAQLRIVGEELLIKAIGK